MMICGSIFQQAIYHGSHKYPLWLTGIIGVLIYTNFFNLFGFKGIDTASMFQINFEISVFFSLVMALTVLAMFTYFTFTSILLFLS